MVNRLNSYQLVFEWKPEESKEERIHYVGNLHNNKYCEADNLSLILDENEINLLESKEKAGNSLIN